MKSKRLFLNYETIEKKSIILNLTAISALTFVFVKLFYSLYLNNPSFHMFIQSKGIFL